MLRGGAVTYCDEIKHRVLGVEQETLDRYTAVSYQTAREMAAVRWSCTRAILP